MNARPRFLPDAAEELLLAMARAAREAEERREAAAYHFEEYEWASALGRDED